jgi:hypothetical protein
MRLASRLAAPAITLAVIAAGCGGSTVAFQEVPGDPPQMSVAGAEAFAPSPTATPTGTAEAATGVATPTPTATADTTGATAPSTSQGTTDTAAGGTTAPSTDDGATNDQPPPAGSPAQQFEDYCASNPGAC